MSNVPTTAAGHTIDNATSGKIIGIFAHNEAQKIIACLDTVKLAITAGDRCIVLNNGSKDNTGELVTAYAKQHDFVSLQEIKVGDKSNAWNVFIHDLGLQARHYYLLDGDCEVFPDSFSELEKALDTHPDALAFAAIPAERGGGKDKEQLLRTGGLWGNLYGLSGSFVQRLRAAGARLPIGFIGDDSLVGALACWDLNPQLKNWDITKVYTCVSARFRYEPLSIFSADDLRLYYRRKIRYSLRHFQNKLVRIPLEAGGVSAMPAHVDQLYADYGREAKLLWRGLDTWFDWLAIKRIHAKIPR